jgi:hypothetical protein
MRGPLIAVVGPVCLAVMPCQVQAAFLASTGAGSYDLLASPLYQEGLLPADTLKSMRYSGASGFALAATRIGFQARSVGLAAWVGSKSLYDDEVRAVVNSSGQILVLPDEQEHSGQPVSLYAQMVVRMYVGNAHAESPPPQFEFEASVRTPSGETMLIAANSGPIAFLVAIGEPVDFSLFVSAAAGMIAAEQFARYAAIDLQLVVGLDATPVGQLVPIPVVPGDGNLDGIVDAADYTRWADHYLQATNGGAPVGDFSGDGWVDGADYTIWADHFSPELDSFAASPIPEPTTRLLLLAGVFCLAGGRRLRRIA